MGRLALLTRIPLLPLAAVVLLLATMPDGTAQDAGRQAEPELTQIQPLITRHCVDCHNSDTHEGGLDLTALSRDLHDEAVFAKWVRIHDRVQDREMPPPSAEQMTDADRNSFTSRLADPLIAVDRARKGRVLRRLNRREYANTVNDLFGTNLDLANMLPEDGRSHEFDNIGSALSISPVQMRAYLEAIDTVLNAAIVQSISKPAANTLKLGYAETRDAAQFLGKQWLKLDDGAVAFFRNLSYPDGMLREASARTAGRYKVRVTGYAYQSDQPITFSIGAKTYARGLEQPTFGYYSMPSKDAAGGKPTTVEIETWIEQNYMITVEPWGISDDYQIKNGGIENYRGPGLAISSIELEGPLVDEFPGRGHRLILDGLDRHEIMPRNPADREKPWYKPKFELSVTDPAVDFLPVLRRVATAAFRRPVVDDQLTGFMDLLQAQLQEGSSPEEALRTAVAAIFCSPEFLFLHEPPGQLDDFALASRLSYFLTRTTPDAELLAAAAAGQLTGDPAVLDAQAERLLNDPRFARFIEDFTDSWLNLREIEFTNPDEQLYPEFDAFLQHSMVEETRAFVTHLFRENLGVQNLVKSDFAMLNNRLAEHYGIEGVSGPEIRRVQLPADSVRGGLLSQASILKVSANGTNTSPVVRGVWVLERILDQSPPPPPPGIAGVEPDIRGASTLRELLDKHRNLDTCRGCHQQIDPPGFALESFNPIGGWQDRFRSLGSGDPVSLRIQGNRVQYKLGPAVDSSGTLPNGRTFTGFTEFRDHLAEDQQLLARAFTTKLLTFATGREMGFSDRKDVRSIAASTASTHFGLRDILHGVIDSQVFRTR